MFLLCLKPTQANIHRITFIDELDEKGFNTVTLTDCTATTSAEGQKAAIEGTFKFFSSPMTKDEFLSKIN